MSWNRSYVSKADFDADVAAPGSSTVVDAEQLAAARNAAVAIMASGAVGGEGKDFVVSLSGHGNPGHEPTRGWANDCVTVNVSQKGAAS